ncbi:polyphosphate kinase 2 family protein [Streptomyces filamentosus]|nr:polyphosphate kinase 2 family protein [Streptomyces filamentosus]
MGKTDHGKTDHGRKDPGQRGDGQKGHAQKGHGRGRAGRESLGALLRLPPGEPVDLSAYDPRAVTGGPDAPRDKTAGRAATALLAPRLAELQERLYAASTAGGRQRLLLVLQGMDTSGKGGTVKHVIGHFNPSGCRIRAFKAPTPEERAHPFLWRVSKALPEPGEIGIFDRSHYEDVLIARVRELAPPEELERRYEEIDRFERSLAEEGVTLVKVFLHLSYEEQRARLLERLDNPEKHWKFDPSDIEERTRWDDYREAYEVAMERCSAPGAPWFLVPADRKWYRNWAVSLLLLEHLEALDPQYPPGGFDVAECRRRLLAT